MPHLRVDQDLAEQIDRLAEKDNMEGKGRWAVKARMLLREIVKEKEAQ